MNSTNHSERRPSNGGGHHGAPQRLPLGHPGRVGANQQFMGQRQPGPVELSNFWNVLSALGGDLGLPVSSHV